MKKGDCGIGGMPHLHSEECSHGQQSELNGLSVSVSDWPLCKNVPSQAPELLFPAEVKFGSEGGKRSKSDKETEGIITPESFKSQGWK